MNNTNVAKNDEIDLIELIKVLWNKKIWILLSAFICTLIAGVYAFTAKEKWTSTAEVIAPTSIDMGKYVNARLNFAQLFKEPLTVDEISKQLYESFERLAFSRNERREFFLQSDEYKRLIEGKDEKAQRQILSNLVIEYTAITRPDPKKNADMFGNRVSFSAETPEAAQNTLTQFIDFINTKAFELNKNLFQLMISQKIEALSNEKQSIEHSSKIQKELNIEVTPSALPAGNIQNQVQSNSTSNTSQSLDSTSALFTYGEQYLRIQAQQIEEQLKKLQEIQEYVKTIKAQAYSYQASPDYPVVKDKPKKALILAIGFIVGLVLSTFIILFSSVIQNSRKEQ
ncbi:LPS O-antigen chain length determinant protein WzzB [Rodentibacter heidelbergensis]|uniref:LPS O-antigen chain length determinant protein WzzB n=1 Tax=Rodentibacter heidelbergensis TaxID=1908258 RepID=UPI000986A306|nr:Wzz/FepE/Etk N-terminal domain-containing protein [Rodentibacter heidelbergensis]